MGQGIVRPQAGAELGQPQQAVVLAGGRGTRLAPISDLRPKPMACLQGRPFLEHLLLDLRSQGIRRFLILVGYQADVIRSYFGDGESLGVRIEYSELPVEAGTGFRLRHAREQIDSHFLLTYADNLCPLDLASMWSSFTGQDALAQLTVYRNADSYTRSNVHVSEGQVRRYARDRRGHDLAGVDIGYVICRNEVLDLLPPDAQACFQDIVYQELIRSGQLAACVTDQRYYSIGSPHRLAETERFLAAPATVLLDRDGVLNAKMPRAHYVESWSNWQWLPGSLDALRVLRQAGVRVVVITNQAGIARGNMTRETVDNIHGRMAAECERAGGYIDAIYMCDHDWDAGCDCRKPKPGMLHQAHRDFAFALRDTAYVGDDSRDAEAAEAAGCPFISINDGFQLVDAAPLIVSEIESRATRSSAGTMSSQGR